MQQASGIDPLSRRRVLGGLATAPALALLPGCAGLVESFISSCPADPAESGGITWFPDVAHPVLWGVHDVGRADGAPRDMTIHYPAATFRAPPILKICGARWPIVLFLHGQPPRPVSQTGWHRKWWRLPSTLVRCGYVVIVPNHPALLPDADNAAPAVADAMRDVDWVRNQWSESKWVSKQPTATAVAGHSYGALLAARVAAAHPEIGALISLSGPYGELHDAAPLLRAVTAPSFFMWAVNGLSITLAFENLGGSGGVWDQLAQPKYAAVYQGDHFDYLEASDTGAAARGCCPLIGGIAAELAALFIASNLFSLTRVPISLTRPQVQLTPEQQVYADIQFNGIDRLNRQRGCRVHLRWNIGGHTGSRRLGPRLYSCG